MNINKEISEITSGANDKPIEAPNEIKVSSHLGPSCVP